MKFITSSLVAAGATVAIVACSITAAQAAVVHGANASAAPAAQAHVRAAAGSFAYEMTATSAGIIDVEHFGQVRDGVGSSTRPEVEADQIKSMGFVAGGTSFVNEVSGAHLSGVAGDDVTSITVLTGSGDWVPAVMDAGIWAAAWQGDPDASGGSARIRFTTKDGEQHSTSTEDVDWIAAAQRQADDA